MSDEKKDLDRPCLRNYSTPSPSQATLWFWGFERVPNSSSFRIGKHPSSLAPQSHPQVSQQDRHRSHMTCFSRDFTSESHKKDGSSIQMTAPSHGHSLSPVLGCKTLPRYSRAMGCSAFGRQVATLIWRGPQLAHGAKFTKMSFEKSPSHEQWINFCPC